MNNEYQKWLSGDDCCCGGFIHIEPCPSHKDVCDCENILLEISKLHTDDEILQEEIDALSGGCDCDIQLKTINGESISGTGNIEITCSGGSVTVDNELSLISTNPVENKVITEALNDKLDASAYTPTTQVQSDWNVTDSGSTAYIKNKPNIPVVPTNVSAFINDMGYLTEHQPLSGYVTNAEFIQVTSNLQEQINSLRSAISGCCGQTGETYTRWVTMTGASDYWCSGTTKMSEEKEQTSTDNINWTDTGNIRNGNTVLETNCEDCGYTPPTPTAATTPRIYNLYEPSKTNVKILYQCPTSSVKEITYKNTGMWRHISACTTNLSVALDVDQDSFNVIFKTNSETIENYMFKDTDISGTISTHRVTTIGNGAYENCTGLTRAYLNGNSVGRINLVSIGNDVFKNCSSMLSVDLASNTIVPTLGTGVFDGCTSLVAIYVNNSLLNTYKTSPGWSAYADKIIGIG